VVANLPQDGTLSDGVLFLSAADVPIFPDVHGKLRPVSLDDVAQIVFETFYHCTDVTHRVHVSFQQAKPYLRSLQAVFVFDQVPLSFSSLERLCDILTPGAVLIAGDGSALNTLAAVEVSGLPRADARRLGAKTAGLDQEDPNTQTLLDQLCHALRDLPLPLILAATLIRQGRASLEQLVTTLETVLDEHDALTRAVRLVLIFLTLKEQAALRALMAAGGADADLDTLQAISKQSRPNLEDALGQLAKLGLIYDHAERYGIISTSLRRVFQRELPYEDERHRAVVFFVTALAHLAGDLDWVAREYGNLISAIHAALEQGWMTELGILVKGIQPLLVVRGLWKSWGQSIALAEQAAQATGDQVIQAWVWHERGTRAGLLGDRKKAAHYLRKALERRRKLGDQTGAATTRQNLKALNIPVAPPGIPWQRWLAGVFVVVGVLVLITGRSGSQASQPLPPTSNPTVIVAVPTQTPTPTMTYTNTPSPPPTNTLSPTSTATNTLAPIPTPTTTPTLTPTSTPVPTVTPIPTPTLVPTRVPPPATDEEAELQVVALINRERQRNGCDVALQVSPELTAAARRHSYDMAANTFLGHTGSDGSRPDDRIEEAGYLWAWGTSETPGWAENAAPFATPAETVQGWMSSSGHRNNMLNCGYREVGVGYAESNSGQDYWTAVFTRGRR
jgi:uncharacterized protein YkwD/tetratricopeptide (TPR) repeat protein